MRNHTIRPQLDQVFPPPYLNQLQKVTFQKNDYICTQGQAITELTYILSGKVKIVRSLFNGKEHILETLNQPQILGDVELMTNQPAGSSVIALEEVQAVQLPLNNKEELLKDPVFLYQIGRNLAMALHKQGITASTNASYSVKERLATHILNSEENYQVFISSFNNFIDINSDKLLEFYKEKIKKEMKVKDAKKALQSEANDKILDLESVKTEALRRAENEGIIFIDEIDKVAVGSGSSNRQDPSKEGVQRDLLPIVEGSNVNTKFGNLKTDHILFIAAGAFHISKPSDLIPELQGRFPLRVELDSLDEDALYQILTQTKNSLLKQYIALLSTENVELEFDDEAIKEIAKIAHAANEKMEDIGARRLHTVIERVIEDISFEASEKSGEKINVTKELVKERLKDVVEDQDLARYIL